MAARGALALCAAATLPAFANTQGVVISQVYGGGGNSGAPLNADFVELHNTGASAVALDGWSVQYASSAGSFNAAAPLSGTLQPGRYYLVAMVPGASGSALPAADANGALALSSSSGKVALASVATPLACTGSAASCAPAVLAQVVDLVGYGSANAFEGSAAAPALSNTTAALRAAAGCADSGDNAADFASGAPAPRNGATAPSTCSGSGGGGSTGTALKIYQIQGRGAKSAWVGQLVGTQGVVTKVDSNGFFFQDVAGDNDPSTSDGLFVFTSNAAAVQAGQLVQATGTVAEFNVGAATNADTAAHTVTELTNVTAISVLNSGLSVAPVVLQMPLAAQDDLERYEGMLVTLRGPFTVQQNYFLGRFGELTLATGGRLEGPTNRLRPGPDALALNADNIRRSILLDDGSALQNPNPTPYIGADDTVRAGDTTAQLTGVVDYGLTTSGNTDPGAYRIQPTVAPVFARTNPRTRAPEPVGGNLRIGSANVLNFFTTLDDGVDKCAPSNTASDCRGANNAVEFGRQRAKILAELTALDADALGLMELQNNGSVAIQSLVDGLNARFGAGTYAFIQDAPTGPGTDAIKVGILYKPAVLTPVGAARSDPAPINNRAPLAQTFRLANGERFNLVVNHLKSKGCDGATGLDLDQGDLQGCWDQRRVQQADELRSFVASVQAASGVNDTLLVGDFNSYAKEDPIVDLTSNGFVDQIARFNKLGYSYVFNGSSGRLDHAIASNTLSPKVTGAYEWHNNADEPAVIDYNQEFKQPACPTCGPDYYAPNPYRASDHDPVLVGLNLVHAIRGTAGRDTLVGTPGDDVITGGAGGDRLTGNGGHDVFVYTAMADLGDTITDFTPGDDRIDLGGLLASLGVAPANAIASGVVQLRAAGADTVLLVDTDGSAGPNPARPYLTLLNVSPAAIDPARDLGLGATPAHAAAPKKAKWTPTMTNPLLSLAALAAALLAPAAHADVANGDFTNGLQGWTTAGDASAAVPGRLWLTTASPFDDNPGLNVSGTAPAGVGFGAAPLESFVGVAPGALDPDPAHFVVGVEGSAARQTFGANGNGLLRFRWDLGTADALADAGHADTAFVVVDGQLHTLGNILQAALPGTDGNVAHTGWESFSVALSNASTHTISFGVIDVGDDAGASTLAIAGVHVSMVPEAPAVALLLAGLGLLGLRWRRVGG